MAENSKIEWTEHTFNPWLGCAKVSDGCKFCYAEHLMDTRLGRVKWGPGGTRVRTSEHYWTEPFRWNKQRWMECGACGWRGDAQRVPFVNTEEGGSWTCPSCAADGRMEPTRQRVFCASLADVFESHGSIPDSWRDELWALIQNTPNLDWLLLTKRPEHVLKMVPVAWWNGIMTWPKNVWIGTSVEDQEAVDRRIPELMKIPAPVRFLSCEPLLGPVDLWRHGNPEMGFATQYDHRGTYPFYQYLGMPAGSVVVYPGIDWVIVGGESGSSARPFNLAWARNLRDQCEAADVPIFIKQLGSDPVQATRPAGISWPIDLHDKKGGDMAEWPVDLQIRQFPTVPSLVKE